MAQDASNVRVPKDIQFRQKWKKALIDILEVSVHIILSQDITVKQNMQVSCTLNSTEPLFPAACQPVLYVCHIQQVLMLC